MIHSFRVYNQYLKHMDSARVGMNYSGPMIARATFHSHWADKDEFQSMSM